MKKQLQRTALFLGMALIGLYASAQRLVDYVQPMAGSSAATTPAALKHGEGLELNANTIPAVTMPFAMTQWTPQTQATEKKCTAPYYYKDTLFSGFRGSHWLSGSCTQDYGSVTIMPVTGTLQTAAAITGIPFRHESETATPYRYDIHLAAYHLQASVTATDRCGFIRLTAERSDSIYILITPNSDYKEGFVQVDALHNAVYGYNPVHRIYQGWGKPAGFNGHFYLQADKAIAVKGVFAGQQLIAADSISNRQQAGAYIGFYLQKGESIQLRIGTSFSSTAGAQLNLQTEIPHWQFEQAVAANKAVWEQTLSQISLQTSSEKDKRIFYTSYYHSLQQPRLYNDVDGTYPMFASHYKLAKLQSGNYYDDFSLWDTYRAHLPLFELLNPTVVSNVAQSLIIKGQQGGWLPIFPCWNSYTSEMIGDHCSSVIASAYLKGIGGFDVTAAYRLMRQNAFDQPASKAEYQEGKGRRALDSYRRYGYIPVEDNVPDAFHKKEQVSRTLEYAYDDYALALMAKKLDKTADYDTLLKRAGYYKNVFDPKAGLVRGRHANGNWVSPYRPDSREYYITEGTPRQYTFYVPQDVPGLATLMGGRARLEQALDTLFGHNEYWHGNEPGHQIPFMYNYTGSPWKTQRAVREILQQEYSDGPGGLSGNDDAGQMSAWYMFAALGFYPLNPVSGEYPLCAPIFDEATIHLPNDKQFTIATKKTAPGAQYIHQVKWNGRLLSKNYLTYQQIMQGGRLEIALQNMPDRTWGSSITAQPAGITGKP